MTSAMDRHSHFGMYDDNAGALERLSPLTGRTTPPEPHATMATETDGERISEVFATHTGRMVAEIIPHHTMKGTLVTH